MDITKISPERLEVLARIQEYEKAGQFDEDVENDPEAPELLPENVDYLCEKFSRASSKEMLLFKLFVNKINSLLSFEFNLSLFVTVSKASSKELPAIIEEEITSKLVTKDLIYLILFFFKFDSMIK